MNRNVHSACFLYALPALERLCARTSREGPGQSWTNATLIKTHFVDCRLVDLHPLINSEHPSARISFPLSTACAAPLAHLIVARLKSGYIG
jgi:hypothetical protein